MATYEEEIGEHADQIEALSGDTRDIVLDALRVRAMDFVADRLSEDRMGDYVADIYRRWFESHEAEMEAQPFNPDTYEFIDNMRREG